MNERLPAYEALADVLERAYDQAAHGKGKIRHANENEPFERQQIIEIGTRLEGNPAAGPLFQAVKKIYESGRVPTWGQAVHELLGAINYIAAAVIMLDSRLPKKREGAE